jgi:hypothetical protein
MIRRSSRATETKSIVLESELLLVRNEAQNFPGGIYVVSIIIIADPVAYRVLSSLNTLVSKAGSLSFNIFS